MCAASRVGPYTIVESHYSAGYRSLESMTAHLHFSPKGYPKWETYLHISAGLTDGGLTLALTDTSVFDIDWWGTRIHE